VNSFSSRANGRPGWRFAAGVAASLTASERDSIRRSTRDLGSLRWPRGTERMIEGDDPPNDAENEEVG